MSAKKAANLFRIYCFMCRCGAAGYSVSMLSVKPELEQAFNQLCSDVVLHIRVVIAVHLREVADISSVSVKDGLYRYGVALMCLYDSVIGEKSVTHGTTPPFPLSAASRQAGYASRLCCVSSRFVLRFLSASSAGSNTKRFPPVSVPAVRQEPPQGNGYLKISSAPGQKTDKFRHSPALENTRLWCLVGQTFLRSSIQGRFPVSTSPPAYGQRQRTHGE